MPELTPELYFIGAIFGAVFILVLAIASVATRSIEVGRRLAPKGAPAVDDLPSSRVRQFVTTQVDERIFGLDQSARGALRKELVRAGFFNAQAVPIYLTARVVLMLTAPPIIFLLLSPRLPTSSPLAQFALAAILVALAYFLPKAVLSRRQTTLKQRFRLAFPDVMDLLLVCVDAGLGLEAALERVGAEMAASNRELAVNIALVGMEVRAGRSTMDALQSFADRVGIEEAASFVTLLRQSSELGTSIGSALRVYSDEMRDRRMSRAEEKAHALPVKLVIPLGACIFPVILIVVMLPLVIRLASVFY